MEIIHGFELVEERKIAELNLTAWLYRHVRSGARLLSLSCEDENKAFGITFRTPPPDSTGIPHIMEHSVLCGSDKYPVREPFIELAKGSLNTFLNAMTYSDKTCYPVASQNTQDFYNLIDVYMDAVLHPTLSEYTLRQEGWHYELEDLDSPMSYKGIVFNEMKGAYSSPDNRLASVTQSTLFPDHLYSLDSGGDPEVIPDLTYEKFVDYHKKYYHPSNAFVYFYGDDDPDERLRRMDAYFEGFETKVLDSSIPLCPPFVQPRQATYSYDAGEEGGGAGMPADGAEGDQAKSQFVVGWVVGEPESVEQALAVDILEHILIGTTASPLHKALIDSGLGEDLAGSGMDKHLRQVSFSVGLKGIRKESAPEIERLIFNTLTRLAQEGIDPATLAASMNTAEFYLRENNTGSFPRGLALMMRCLCSWLYERDPFGPLAFDAPLAAIKQHLADGERYFENLISQWLLNNQHRASVLLEPDSNYGRQLQEHEQARLDRERQSMTRVQIEDVIQMAQELQRRQDTPDTPEALATLPGLKVADLEKKNKLIPLEILPVQDVPLYYHDLFTNRIVYLDLGFNLHALPAGDLPLVNLFGRALLEMGAGGEDFVQLSQRIGRSTGGIRAMSVNTALRESRAGSSAWFFLRCKATLDKTADLFSVLRDILTSPRLSDRERFRQLVLEEKANAEARIIPAGNRLVNLRLRSRFDEAGWAAEQIDGITNLYALRALVEQVENDWPAVQGRLEEMLRRLISRRVMICNLTLDAYSWETIRPELTEFVASLPAGDNRLETWHRPIEKVNEGLTIPAQVNYVGMGANLYDLGYNLHGSALVIDNFLGTTWLWEKVRVQGGAYGGNSVFDQRSGVFTFLSYRDPNIESTLEAYRASADFLAGLDDRRLNPSELEKIIIGTIGEMDFYQLPDAKGFTSLVRKLAGDRDEQRQQMREQILATTRADFHAFGELLKRFNQAAQVVVLGSASALDAANASSQAPGNLLSIQKVM